MDIKNTEDKRATMHPHQITAAVTPPPSLARSLARSTYSQVKSNQFNSLRPPHSITALAPTLQPSLARYSKPHLSIITPPPIIPVTNQLTISIESPTILQCAI